MTRFAPRLMVLLLCGSALAGCASTPDDIASATKPASGTVKQQLSDLANTPGDLESSVRQAQLARVAGQYDQAVHILSQLMLVAADDPRVVGEYGKTLAEQGRAAEAVQFLSRASELSTNDWTIYSALGVAYDQMGNQASARAAYERALTLRPGEPSVLSNYALSRMLADDPQGARVLIGRAEIAGGASDPKIARNIALIDKLAPAPQAPAGIAYAVRKPAPEQMAASRPLPQQPLVIPAPPPVASTGAPRPLMAQQAAPGAAPRAPVAQQSLPAVSSPYAPYQAVVMQRVPVDPLAGPVKSARHVARAPAAPHVAEAGKPDDKGVAIGKPVLPKAAAIKAEPVPVKTAAKPDPKARNAVPALRMTADARNP